jgi:CheY-like chemotaxis protein
VIVVSVVADEKLAAAFAVHDALSKPLHRERLLRSLQRAGVTPDRDGRILVVDDDPGSLQLMETTLRELGYRTTCVHEGQRGLEEARASRPLAVVLDLMMPEMNGFEFLDIYRRTPENRDVPVIIWTMKELSPEDERVLRASAQSVVQKEGVDAAALVEILRAHCRTASVPEAPAPDHSVAAVTRPVA